MSCVTEVPRRALLLAFFVCGIALWGIPASAPAQEVPRRADPRPLPLVELPAPGHSSTMALVMSGDGDWANFIRALADSLVSLGIPVVGLESRKYLSRPRSPGEVARDMEAVLRRYLDAWSADSVVVVGYSRGADFAPFVVNRLSPDIRGRVVGLGLLSPTRMASFEFHLLDLIRTTSRPTDVPMAPEMEALGALPVLCIYGRSDEESLCPLLSAGTAELHSQASGHRLHDAGAVARALVHLLPGAGAP